MPQAAYRVGRFTLTPHRELLNDGVPVAIGQKALAVLSVLAQADGGLVTKDELMAAVWPHLVVEDNALQAQIAAVRRLLDQDAALLSTTRGRGYRLTATVPGAPAGAPAGPAPAQGAPGAAQQRSRPLATASSAAMSLLIVCLAGLWPLQDRLGGLFRPLNGEVALQPFQVDDANPATRAFAIQLHDRIVGALSASQVPVTVDAGGAGARPGLAGRAPPRQADLSLDAAVRRDGTDLNVQVHLNDARERLLLWAEAFRGAAATPDALQAKIAAAVADVAYWAKVTRSGPVKLHARSVADFIAARESTTGVRNGSNAVALADYEAVVAAAPRFSWGHSGTAVSAAFSLVNDPLAPDAAAMRATAQREAQRALTLDPHNGEAFLAQELLLPRSDWSNREALLAHGAAADPSFEPVALMEGRLLWAAGRGGEALDWFERAHDLNALHNGASFSYALALASEGRLRESRALLTRMEAEWPDHDATREARFWIALVSGAPGEALALLDDPDRRPFEADDLGQSAWRAALQALSHPQPRRMHAAIEQVRQAAANRWIGPGRALALLAMLGDVDGAFGQAASYRLGDPITPPYLFLPQTAPLRRDRRFPALARGLGLAAYWSSTGRWPDFCSEPGLAYDCRKAMTGP